MQRARARTWWVPIAVALVMAVGCGSSEGPGTAVGSTASSQLPPGEVHRVGLTKVVGAEGTSLTVLTDPMPPIGATGECAADVTTQVVEGEQDVQVDVEVASDAPRFFEGCDPVPRELTIDLPSPIGSRRVTTGTGGWFSQEGGAWVGCGHVVMTCVTEPASCEGGSLRDTVSNADVPKGFGMDHRCEEPWAVVDIDIGAAACPGESDLENPCAGRNIRRTYWQVQAEAWVEVGQDDGPGCGAIHDQLPDFPARLCEDLPAVR